MLTFLRGSLPARRSPSLQREMKSDMTAEAFVERHVPCTLLTYCGTEGAWLHAQGVSHDLVTIRDLQLNH